MATPLVAGCAAVLREFVITQKGIANPSAALIKALLINGAHPMAGQYPASETGAIPNVNEGFGRVDVAAVVGPLTANQQLVMHDEATALDTGAEEKISLDVPAGASLLKATLVWTDPSGEGLQNDLDLIVRAPNGDERHGNQAATAATFDRTNNVEQVMWTTLPAGTFEVVVQAFRAAQFPQSYALVVRVE